MGAAPRLSRDGWKGKLQAVARARGLRDEQVQAVTGRPVSYSGIVKVAGDEARDSDLTGQDALFCWMLSSGIAHAKTWAVLSAVLDRVEVPGVPGLAGHQVGLMLSASDKAVTLIASVTTLMVMEGWRLLDERGRGRLP